MHSEFLKSSEQQKSAQACLPLSGSREQTNTEQPQDKDAVPQTRPAPHNKANGAKAQKGIGQKPRVKK